MAEYGLYGAMVRHSLPLPPHLTPNNAPWLLGMHKKAKVSDQGTENGQQTEVLENLEESEEVRRSNSIASLRKRAMEHINNNNNTIKQDHDLTVANIKKEYHGEDDDDDDERCETPPSPALSI